MPWRVLTLLATSLAIVASFARPAGAQSADNVLVVVNGNSPASIEVGEYYAKARQVPASRMIRLSTSTDETLSRTEYERAIEGPVSRFLVSGALQDVVLYIVLTKGVPLRIAGTGGRDGTVASVDSELTLLYRKLLGQPPPAIGRVPNPYFLDDRPASEARPFTRTAQEIYLVTRLDGFTVDDVKGLIDRSTAPAVRGTIVLDEKATLIDRGGDQRLTEAAARLRDAPGIALLHEETRAPAATDQPVLGYYSWGSNDVGNVRRRSGLTFAPGAIGGTFVSTDGRTFIEPPPAWSPSGPAGGPPHRGSFQSLAGDLIRDGITGVAAHVDEPFLDGTVRPQVLFPVYVAGLNLAEAFYAAMPFLSWQTIVIGDPLCAPFRRDTLAPAAIAEGVDPDSDMPAIFTRRRIAALGQPLDPKAVKMLLRLDVAVVKGEATDVEPVLVAATAIEPRLGDAHLRLASLYGARGDFDRSIERFRRVVELAPGNVIALNDLAWTLADKKQRPAEALPFAERALKLAPLPPVLDTIGWIHHLLGQDDRGIAYMERAAAAAPQSVEILLHAATMHQALGFRVTARRELAQALKLDPKAAERPEVKALQALLAP
ncbi:MAG: TIGR03790 family protein [Acidobacteria bacterium]|nr:TIGR03790 family protein [Acidobacteriota bacterium]